MTDAPHQSAAAIQAERAERRWSHLSIAIVALLVAMATFAGIHQATMPQTHVETVDPSSLHIAGEFTESNLGSAVNPDGSVTVRFVAQQYSFTPACLLVPADTPITLRATSGDVVHGFLIADTSVNLNLVPGYVSTISTRFSQPGDYLMPCHEFCGVGHEGMWGHVKVVDRGTFQSMARGQGRLSCASQ
jgi:cytochrome c oxidase subunit 2